MKTQKVNFPNKWKMLFLDNFFKDDSVVLEVYQKTVEFYNAAQLYYAYLGIPVKKLVIVVQIFSHLAWK